MLSYDVTEIYDEYFSTDDDFAIGMSLIYTNCSVLQFPQLVRIQHSCPVSGSNCLPFLNI